ncbi:MAG: hypothetical protein WD749_04385, partial [Phycisphaerales bacterium]
EYRLGEPTYPEAWERDYYRVRDDGGQWLWIFREAPLVPVRAARPARVLAPRWFIHGLWA